MRKEANREREVERRLRLERLQFEYERQCRVLSGGARPNLTVRSDGVGGARQVV